MMSLFWYEIASPLNFGVVAPPALGLMTLELPLTKGIEERNADIWFTGGKKS